MSTLDGVGAPAGAVEAGGAAAVRSVGGTSGVAAVRGVSASKGIGLPAPAPFDPLAEVTSIARGASAPPPAGLSARLMEWAAPGARQFESVAPSRLLPLLTVAVDRLANEAQTVDLLGELGAVALARELRDHQALAERRATMIEA